MRNHALALLFAFVLSFTAVLAQDFPSVGVTGQLTPVNMTDRRPAAPTITCGQYFMYTPPSDTQHVGVLLIASVTQVGGQNNCRFWPWGTDKYEIVLDNAVAIPTTKMLRAGGPVYPWATITMSRKEYVAATACLSTVRVVGARSL